LIFHKLLLRFWALGPGFNLSVLPWRRKLAATTRFSLPISLPPAPGSLSRQRKAFVCVAPATSTNAPNYYRDGVASADVLGELASNAAPVPLETVITQGADQVQHDASEPGFSQDCLHKTSLAAIAVLKG
jgi:hypothetical protein